MKLNGNYGISDIVNALQGNFGCTDMNKTTKGKPLDDKFIRLELFFISVEIHYAVDKRLEIFRIDESNGVKGYVPLLTLRGE